MLAAIFAQADAASAESLTRDSAILGEQFYFFTVVFMWLIHAGFMSYEAGVARRKNVMATAMKNILTIAVVTPTFYYFGWWIYNCNQPGLPIGPNSSDFTAAACQGGIPWSDTFGPNLTNNINLVFFLAFLLFSWTTASIMSGAIIERARLTGYLLAMASAAMVVYAGNWIEKNMRVDDAVGAVAVHGVAGFLGMLWVGVFAAGYPTGINNVESSIGGQMMGILTFLPLGFLSGYVASFVLKRLNLLRVPAEVELEGLDLAEYETDFYPEHGRAPERIIEPDGTAVHSEELLLAEAAALTNGGRPDDRVGAGLGVDR